MADGDAFIVNDPWQGTGHLTDIVGVNTVAAGSDMGVFRWDEPTARWTHLPSPMQDVWAVAVDPRNPDMLIAGTRPAGFWRSADAGKAWTPLKVDGSAIYGIDIKLPNIDGSAHRVVRPDVLAIETGITRIAEMVAKAKKEGTR